MKQLILLALILLFTTSNTFASDPVKYVHKIVLETKQGNLLKGILMNVTDSTVLIFPGKWGDLKRRKTYKTVQFSYSRIEQVQLKWKRRIKNAMTAGGVAGGLLAQKMNSGSRGNHNISYATAISITGGSIAGGLVASKLDDRIFINGNKELFQYFIKIVKPYLQ